VNLPDLTGARWRKSGRSGAQGNCVEIADNLVGIVAMRNSRFPEGPTLVFSRAEFADFLGSIRDGEFVLS
jgi:hypothetical protein